MTTNTTNTSTTTTLLRILLQDENVAMKLFFNANTANMENNNRIIAQWVDDLTEYVAEIKVRTPTKKSTPRTHDNQQPTVTKSQQQDQHEEDH